jgi:hypothetical protein
MAQERQFKSNDQSTLGRSNDLASMTTKIGQREATVSGEAHHPCRLVLDASSGDLTNPL